MRTLAHCEIKASADIVSARVIARRLAERLGFDRQDQTRVATAVSEIARNAFVHAGGGDVEFLIDAAHRPPLFTVLVRDHGTGIADLEAVLAGQKAFPPGLGTGLGSARRLVDVFEVRSTGAGTTVRLSQRMASPPPAAVDASALADLARQVASRGPDPMAVLHEQNRELLASLDDLHERQAETSRLNRELEDTNRGVVALYSELDQKAEQLRSASDMKSRFLSHMSHEFRTPLNSILALSRLLADGVDGPLTTEQGKQVEYIRRSAQTLLEMINDLLDLAKVEAGKLDVRPSEFTVESLFASLRGSLRPLLVNPAVELVVEEPRGLPPLFADEQKVAQVLRNFISNALKFTERGEVRVSAEHLAASGAVLFSVRDTGIGIDPQSMPLIFEEFSQVDGRLQKGGTGLGLPLSRQLALLMGGEVTAESTPEVGSTFRLRLPVRFGQPPVETPASPRAASAPCVLIVDDEEAFRYIIRHVAQDAGYAVLEAPDGEAGLQFAREQRPDMMFLDLHMPRLDGFAVLGQLQASELRSIPVVVCTAHALAPEQKRSLARAHAILAKKDITRDGLTALMQSMVRESAA